jgi:hypothetical protein
MCSCSPKHYLLTYSMEQSPSWEANWFAASQEIPRVLWNPKVQYRTHKRPPPVPILNQPNPVHTPTSHFPKIRLKIILPSTPGSPQWSPSLSSPKHYKHKLVFCIFSGVLKPNELSDNFFFHDAITPIRAQPTHYRGFIITLRHNTFGRTPLDEWSARRRDLYLTTHNTQNRQASMPRWDSNPQSKQRSHRRTTTTINHRG